ncbi:unnamed protein product [Lactuca virosa]|uniref:Thil AANH domain-containing protein n=1 Tax=Lactuca virosa TaxID=75947 RepID=A0AAU9PW97_9ASTR|nr:unnamed protein product [Lactuca virosa]
MMLRTITAALFHPTTKLYYLPLKAFLSHSLHKPQRLINRQSYPRADRTILSINTPRSLSSTAVPQISNETTSDLDSSYLSCSMTNSKHPFKITVLLGGGIDSNIALRLLHAVGHSCTAFYLKIWFKVHMLFFLLTLQCIYESNHSGAFMDAISNMDFEFVSFGHYAKVIHPLTDETNELSFLQQSKDMVKICSTYLHYQLPDTNQ